MKRILKIRFLVVKNLLFLMAFFSHSIFFASFQAGASQYFIGGYLQTWAEQDELREEHFPQQPWLKLQESLLSMGPMTNYAEAGVRADLTTGYVGNFTYAVNGYKAPNYWLIASAEASVYWKDTLYFTIPPGSYPNGLSVTMTGSLHGVLYTFGDYLSQARQSWNVWLKRAGGGPTQYFRGTTSIISSNNVLPVAESFSLTITLLNEGTTLEEDTIVGAEVFAGLGDGGTTLSAANSHSIDSVAHVNFYHTIKIRSLMVPEGIDWTSASGVFLLGCEGDFNNDTDVDGSDLAVFAADFGRTDCSGGPTCEGDFDGDNDVDGSDLATFAADFGRTDCP
jgi:hypothetical protein